MKRTRWAIGFGLLAAVGLANEFSEEWPRPFCRGQCGEPARRSLPSRPEFRSDDSTRLQEEVAVLRREVAELRLRMAELAIQTGHSHDDDEAIRIANGGAFMDPSDRRTPGFHKSPTWDWRKDPDPGPINLLLAKNVTSALGSEGSASSAELCQEEQPSDRQVFVFQMGKSR